MLIEEFNKKYTIGSKVSFMENGETVTSTTRWTAELLPDKNTPVIWVHGRIDAVELSKVIKDE